LLHFQKCNNFTYQVIKYRAFTLSLSKAKQSSFVTYKAYTCHDILHLILIVPYLKDFGETVFVTVRSQMMQTCILHFTVWYETGLLCKSGYAHLHYITDFIQN